VFIPVRVWIDDALDTLAFRIRPKPPVQIEPMRVAIQFNPRARLRTHVNHRLRVDWIRFAFQKQPSGHVGDCVNKWILRRADQSFCVLRFAAGWNVQARYDYVQFCEQFVVEIQPVA